MAPKKQPTGTAKKVKDLKPKANDVKGGRLASSVLKKLDDTNKGVIGKI
jgi:hypothetical protein